MNEIQECGNTRAIEITDTTGGIYEALRSLDSELKDATDNEITTALLKLKLDTINESFFEVKERQHVVYTKGEKVQVVDQFDPSCNLPLHPSVSSPEDKPSEENPGIQSKLAEMSFPHLVASSEFRTQKAQVSVAEQRKNRPHIKDFCAKFTGYNFYYITGKEGVLSQDAWTFIPYLLSQGISTEISNGDEFVFEKDGKIQSPKYFNQEYQNHLQQYLDAIEENSSPKAVGLHFSRTAYSNQIIDAKEKFTDADLNSHSAIALPGQKTEISLSGSVRQTLNREYTHKGAKIDWNSPLLDRIEVQFPPESTKIPLSQALNRRNAKTMIVHDTFIEESFGPDFRRRSLTLTLLTVDNSKPLFTAVSAAKLSPKYQDYFQDPAIKALQNSNIEFNNFTPGKKFVDIITQKIPDMPAYGEDYFKLQQIYHWLFRINPEKLQTNQPIPILESVEEIDKYFKIVVESLRGSHIIMENSPREKLETILVRVVGSSINASETEIKFFFDENPETAQEILTTLASSDPQSYLGQIITEGSTLDQSVSLKGTFFLSPAKQREIQRKTKDTYYAHKQLQEQVFKDSGINIPKGFPYSYELLQAVAPNPRDQITLLAIWKNEQDNEAPWKNFLQISRKKRVRAADRVTDYLSYFGDFDETSVGEMQTQENMVRLNFDDLSRRLKDFPNLYQKHLPAIEAINKAIKERKPSLETNELIEKLLISSPEVSLIAAQIVNEKNLFPSKVIAQRTGTDWDGSTLHQARILANTYNLNPVRARTIEDYNRWIIMAEKLGILQQEINQEKFPAQNIEGNYQVNFVPVDYGVFKIESKPLDKNLFYETISRVINFVLENWASDNPQIAKIREKLSIFQFDEQAQAVLKDVKAQDPNKLLSSTLQQEGGDNYPQYKGLATLIQTALEIDMSTIPLSDYNKNNPSQAILRGNYGARALNQLLKN